MMLRPKIKNSAWDALVAAMPDGPHAAIEVTYTNRLAGSEAYVRVIMCRREPRCVGGHNVIWSRLPDFEEACRVALAQFNDFVWWGDRS